MTELRMWGLHMGIHVGNAPVDRGYVAIGWQALGDPTRLEPTRDAFKQAVAAAYPGKKPGAIPVDAGTLFKFVHEIRTGDLVVYPSKHDRQINVGRFDGGISWHPDDPDEYPTHRAVTWLGHFPRSDFSQSALNEIGSFVTLFRVRKHVPEFLSRIGASAGAGTTGIVTDRAATEPEDEDDDSATAAVTRHAVETAKDFVIRSLMAGLTGYQFEEFVAHLLECLGYSARVTQRSGDGGVDVIAHRDALGFEPPIIKVQCKRTTGQHSNSDVNQLLGTLGEGEYGLFVTLGSFTRAATEVERSRPKLRLIDGDTLVEMILAHYPALSPQYRTLLPLKQIYVPDLPSP